MKKGGNKIYVTKCHDRDIYMKDGKKFSHYISHTSVYFRMVNVKSNNLSIQSSIPQYISNELPRK